MRRLGPYELVQPLGRGGMAEVWKGIRRVAVGDAQKVVAIKRIASHSVLDPRFRALFVREARVSMLLNHSTIAQVFDVGVDGDQLYMAMEFIDGLNAHELLLSPAGRHLDFELVAYIVAELLRALVHAHEFTRNGEPATIVHRDISPHNLMLSVAGEVKVMDFGIASICIEETSASTAKGKLRYMPPEQLIGSSRSPAVDLFAVGAVLYELIEPKRFRECDDEVELYRMVISGYTPPLRRAGIPRQLRVLYDHLIARGGDDRIQSAREALEYLYSWPGFRNASLELGALVTSSRQLKIEGPEAEVDTEDTTSVESTLDHPTLVRPVKPATRVSKASLRLTSGRLVTLVLAGLVLTAIGLSVFTRITDARAVVPEVLEIDAWSLASPDDVSLWPDVRSPFAREFTPPPVAATARIDDEIDTSEVPANPRPAKVEVLVTRGDYFCVVVKIGRQPPVSLQKTSRVSVGLRPGGYAVSLQPDCGDEWVSAGKIRVEAGQRYKLEPGRPAQVGLSPL